MDSKFCTKYIFLLLPFILASCGFSQELLLKPEHMQEKPMTGEAIVELPTTSTVEQPEPILDFKTAVAMVKDGRRDTVTILHIGDSHVAGDFMTDVLRSYFQKRFGDAGRGLISPPSLKGYRATGVDQELKGKWENFNSRDEKGKDYGLAGVIMQTQRAGATYSVAAENTDSITFHLLSNHDGGKVKITSNRETKTLVTGSPSIDLVTITVLGDQAELRSMGGGSVSVVGVDLHKNKRGVRYINMGLPGATGEVNKFWSRGLMRAQLEVIKPDLIIWSYGTNEGFDDDFKPEKYVSTIQSTFDFIKATSPQADWVIVGAPDGQRKTGEGSRCSDGWKRPIKIDEVNKTLAQMARDNNFAFFDWSKKMGGKCSMVKWIKQGHGGKDHVHFKISGYEKSATLLQRFLESTFGI